MTIVVVDHPDSLAPEVFSPLAELGTLAVYPRCSLPELLVRLARADAAITFATHFRRELLDYIPRLRAVVTCGETPVVEQQIAAELGVVVIDVGRSWRDSPTAALTEIRRRLRELLPN